MTPRQRDLLGYIHSYIVENEGVAPSFDQMKAYLNLASKSGIHRLVTALEGRGYISKDANKARAILVTSRGVDALQGKLIDEQFELKQNRRVARALRMEAHKFKFYSGTETLKIMAERLEQGDL